MKDKDDVKYMAEQWLNEKNQLNDIHQQVEINLSKLQNSFIDMEKERDTTVSERPHLSSEVDHLQADTE